MTTRYARFWMLAFAAAAGVGVAALLMVWLGPLGLEARADRERGWLLIVGTAGVLAVLFGTASWLGGPRRIGLRDVVAAGSVTKALEARRITERAQGPRFELWTVAFGLVLIAMYFVGWIILG